ncbi:uncharacterized protein JCM6883_000278 [Sporobolomyces salmoneus]|uniref:uncharacterized protein n=1 Tax=Sporobolomyces salmoneus TaxID=183962 RepID=UPI00317DE8CF
MASTSRAVASASEALTKASTTSTPARRRVSKRTLQSSSTSSLSSLISLYHLSPTFVPTSNPPRLQQHLTNTLAPIRNVTNKPRPHHLIDLVHASHDLDTERTKLDTELSGSAASATLLGLKLRQGGFQGDSFANLPFENDGMVYDHQNSFFANHTVGQEAPLARRVRRIVDKLHGTEAGGRAGLNVLREQGGKAVEWKEGLREARTREKQREAQEEQEAEAFGKEFTA